MHKYGKGHSIIQQPPNPTLFSGPIECRIREVSLYMQCFHRVYPCSVLCGVRVYCSGHGHFT